MKKSRTYMDFRLFKKRVESGKAPDQALLRMHNSAQISPTGSDRVFRFVFSDDSVDRYGNTVNQSGWVLDNFKNGGGPLLWAHQYDHPPVGKVKTLGVNSVEKRTTLGGDVEFTPKGMSDFNDMIHDMVAAGFLNATSVGFTPIEYEFNEQRNAFDFSKQELLEISVVPIPANPNALIEARSAGIDLNEMERWVNDGLFWLQENDSLLVPTETLEMVAETLGMEMDAWHSPTEVIKEMLEANVTEPEAEEVEAEEVEDLNEVGFGQISDELIKMGSRIEALEAELVMVKAKEEEDLVELSFDEEDSSPEDVFDISIEDFREICSQSAEKAFGPIKAEFTKMTGKIID